MATLSSAPANPRALFSSILQQLPDTRPVSLPNLQAIISSAVANSPSKNTLGWDTCLKREAIGVVSRRTREGGPLDEAYFQDLFIRLDIALICADLAIADHITHILILSDLFDMHTVEADEKLFEWLESRSAEVTKNLVPSKSKALNLLRQLNNLGRRVSRTGNSAKFNGRILNFLSSAFSLAERSGVNMKGEYGPQWEDVPMPVAIPSSTVSSQVSPAPDPAEESMEEGETSAMEGVEPTAVASSPESSKAEFYQTFWALQKAFSDPSVFEGSERAPMVAFQTNVKKVLGTLAEATKKDQTPSVNVTAGVKRKRDEEEAAAANGKDASSEYFFAKFLTNYDLLDLEIADIHFRRQILIQILILLSYLRTYSASEKEKWVPAKTSKGSKPRRMDVTLSEEDEKWLEETYKRCLEELQAPVGGVRFKVFADTVVDLLDRERAWARWKSVSCPDFEKPPMPYSEYTASSQKLRDFLAPIPPLEHALGTEDLTDTWDSGYRGIEDLESTPAHTSFDRYVRDYKALGRKIDMKEKQLAMLAAKRAPAAVPVPAPPPPAAVHTTPPKTSTPLPSVPSTPSNHGLPPRPINPLGIPSRPGTPSSSAASTVPAVSSSPARPPSSSPAPPAKEVPTPAPAPAPAAPAKLSDPQLEGFLEQRETLVWRGLRAAAQEGYLHQLNKIKDKDPSPSSLGDLEKLQAKLTAMEAEVAAAAAKTAAKEAESGAASGMEVDGKVEGAGDAKPVSVLKTEEDVEMKVDVKTEGTA